jgi:hypothetical protein
MDMELPGSVRSIRYATIALEPVIAGLLVAGWWRGAYDSEA